MIVKLPFGHEQLALDLRGIRVRPLAPTAPPGQRDIGGLVAQALDSPLEGDPLSTLACDRSTVTILVPDSTRKAWLPEVLPAVILRLEGAGIDASAITVLVANGTHPSVGEEAVATLVGPLPDGVRVVEHDSRRLQDLVVVGKLGPDRDLHLNRRAVESDLLITVGTVRHHYFAGFGGGPKMVFPGIGAYDEIQTNHSLVLRSDDRGSVREPACEPGLLIGNPVADEIAKAADLYPPDLALCLVEGNDGNPAWAGAGPWRTAFAAAVDKLRIWFETSPGAPFQLMVACGGGSPSDATLIQGHKSFDAVCRFLAPGGELLYVAALDGGLGSPMMEPFIRDPRPERILEALAEKWVQYGHTTLRLVEKTSRYRVSLCSNLDPVVVCKLGFEPVVEPDEIIERWRREYPGETVGVMAGAPVFPRN